MNLYGTGRKLGSYTSTKGQVSEVVLWKERVGNLLAGDFSGLNSNIKFQIVPSTISILLLYKVFRWCFADFLELLQSAMIYRMLTNEYVSWR